MSLLVPYNTVHFKVYFTWEENCNSNSVWVPFAWNAFFHPFAFSLYVSLGLKWVCCRQHIYRSCFLIHSASLCLLVEAFNPLTFQLTTIYLYCHFNHFGFAFVYLVLLLSFLPREAPLVFVVKLVWWCWILLVLLIYKVLISPLNLRALLGRVFLVVGFPLSSFKCILSFPSALQSFCWKICW